jgi:hypothetical protein
MIEERGERSGELEMGIDKGGGYGERREMLAP